MKKLAILGLVAVAGVASADLLYNNGPVFDAPGAGFGGANLSQLISPNSLFGAGAQTTANNVVADNFTATNNWIVQSISFYSYQTGATAFTFTGANWSIRSGSVTGTVVASGTNSPVSNGGFVAYRALNTAPTNTQRPIYRVDVTGLNVALSQGTTYWLTWSLAGTLASGPWVPPVVPTNGGGNALQSVAGGAFNPLLDGGSQRQVELPFELNGVVPEPGTMIALGAGIAAVAARRRRK